MADINTSQQLLVALRAADGRHSALEAAYDRYFFRMVALMRKRLPGYLQHKADPADLAQSAWGSFIDGLARGQLDLDGRESLWPLLALIAIRKFQHATEHYHAQCRDVRREKGPTDPAEKGRFEPTGGEPTPLEDLAVRETITLLQERLGDERQQKILYMRLQGYQIEEIAEEVQLSSRSVKRILQKVRDLWQEIFAEDIAEDPVRE